MKIFSTSLLFLVFLITGCSTPTKDFNLVFTMESTDIYKLSIEINGNKSYRIQQENLFFDSHAKKERINRSEGELSNKEYKKLLQLISGSQLFECDNTYGFNQNNNTNNDPLKGIIYHLNYTEGNKAKYILIHPNPSNNYPSDFSLLIKFLSDFSSKRIKK